MKTLLLLALLALLRPLAAAEPIITKYSVGLLPRDSSAPYWLSFRDGAQKAATEYEKRGLLIYLVWQDTIPADNMDEQNAAFATCASQRLDGLLFAPVRPADQAPLLLAPRQPGPVVTIGAQLPGALSAVLVDQPAAGAKVADHLATTLHRTGKILSLRSADSSPEALQRETGFMDALKLRFKTVEALARTIDPADPDTSIQQILAETTPDAIFTPDAPATTALLAHLPGPPPFLHVSGQLTPATQSAFIAGRLQAILAEDPAQIGYTAMQLLVQRLRGSAPTARKLIEARLITTENKDRATVKPLLLPLPRPIP